MKTLSYPPVFFAVFVLHALTATATALAHLQTPLPAAVLCAVLYAIALVSGYTLARRSFVPDNAAQAGQVLAAALMVALWLTFVGRTAVFIFFGLALLLVRDAMLTTRRALYFDLAILLALFYDAIGREDLPWRWPIAVAFLLALVFLLMSDYTERRLDRLNLGETGARLHPGFANAAFSTVLVLAAAAFVYVLMPQPRALDIALLPDAGPPEPSSTGRIGKMDRGSLTGQKPQGGATDGSAPTGGDNAGGAAGGRGGKLEELDGERASGLSCTPPLVVLLVGTDRPLYLRTHAYGLPVLGEWHEAPPRWLRRPDGRLARDGWSDANVSQKILVRRPLDDHIPAAHLPARILFPTNSFGVSTDGTVMAPEPVMAGTEYHVRSIVRYLGERPSGRAETAPHAEYLRLPRGLSPRVGQLAREVTAQYTAPSERAAALETYLREQYAAGVFEPRRGIDPSEQFLFETRAGASRAFAEALAVMLRSIGIPSRIASGYRARRLNPLHDAYEVWRTDRHNWVEAYIEHAWVAFEPTPWADLPAQSRAATPWIAAREYVRLAREPATEAILTGDTQPEIAETYLYKVLIYGWFATYGALLVLALVAFAAAAYRWRAWSRPIRDLLDRLRLRYPRYGDPRRVVRRAFAAIERIAARRDLARGRGENHAEYLRRLAAARPHLRLPCDTLALHFGVARYGQRLTADGARAAHDAALIIASLIDERPR